MEDASIWRRHVAEWRASGMTAPAYCEAHGLPVNRLRYWAYKRRDEAERSKTTAAAPPSVQFARVVAARRAAEAVSNSDSIVVSVGGVRVSIGRGFDRETLAEVVGVLSAGDPR